MRTGTQCFCRCLASTFKKQFNLFAIGVNGQDAWAKTTQTTLETAAEASTSNSNPSSSEWTEEDAIGEESDFEPTFVVLGRSLLLDKQESDAARPAEDFSEESILPLNPWVAEPAQDGTTITSAFPTVMQSLNSAVSPDYRENCPDFLINDRGDVPFVIAPLGPIPFMETVIPTPLRLGFPSSIQFGNEDSNQPSIYTYLAPSVKYGNEINNRETLESPTLAEQFETWKEWTLNDYCTAFRYISQQFAQVDWATVLANVQEGEPVDQESLDLEMLFWTAE